jgi:hypothetical protein
MSAATADGGGVVAERPNRRGNPTWLFSALSTQHLFNWTRMRVKVRPRSTSGYPTQGKWTFRMDRRTIRPIEYPERARRRW